MATEEETFFDSLFKRECAYRRRKNLDQLTLQEFTYKFVHQNLFKVNPTSVPSGFAQLMFPAEEPEISYSPEPKETESEEVSSEETEETGTEETEETEETAETEDSEASAEAKEISKTPSETASLSSSVEEFLEHARIGLGGRALENPLPEFTSLSVAPDAISVAEEMMKKVKLDGNVCRACGASFALRKTLSLHIKTHTKEC